MKRRGDRVRTYKISDLHRRLAIQGRLFLDIQLADKGGGKPRKHGEEQHGDHLGFAARRPVLFFSISIESSQLP